MREQQTQEQLQMTNLFTAPPLAEQLTLPTPEQHLQYSRIDLTQQQKNWLKDRDLNCQFPLAHICTGILHLHHIIPQFWAQAEMGEDFRQINEARRIIRLCENIHVGKLETPPDPNILHPDHRQARLDYQVDKHAFQDVGVKHRDMVLQHVKYWFFGNDEDLLDISNFRTRLMERKYQHPYPVGGKVNGRVIRK